MQDFGFADHTPLSVGRKLTTFARASSYLLNKKLEPVVFHNAYFRAELRLGWR